LIEDDYVDLSIVQFYEQVWKKSSSQSTNAVATTLLSSNVATLVRDSPPMTATYRLQRLRNDLKLNQEQLKLHDVAFSVDAIEPAKGILLIMESLIMEANESDNINISHNALTVSNKEAGAGEQAKKIVEFDQLQKQNLENPKDETVSPQASKQRITEVAVRHLKDSFVFTGEAGFKSSPEWHSGRKLPFVPLILAMLRGLSMGHLQATSYTLEAVYKTCSSKKAKPLGCSSLDSLHLNCLNLSELNLNSCKALLPVNSYYSDQDDYNLISHASTSLPTLERIPCF
nr:hypothetical protein [Tanacetum cinerariifolium]